MTNHLLTILNWILAAVFLGLGVKLLLSGPSTLAVIALPLYAAAGFGAAAQGLRVNNVWLVTMSTLALLGCSGLYLLIFLLGELPHGFDTATRSGKQLLATLALSVWVVFNQGYAMWRNYRKTSRH